MEPVGCEAGKWKWENGLEDAASGHAKRNIVDDLIVEFHEENNGKNQT